MNPDVIRPVIFYTQAHQSEILCAIEVVLKNTFYPLNNVDFWCSLLCDDLEHLRHRFDDSVKLGSCSDGGFNGLVFVMPQNVIQDFAARMLLQGGGADYEKPAACDGIKALIGECILDVAKGLCPNNYNQMLFNSALPDQLPFGHGCLNVEVSWFSGSMMLCLPSHVCLSLLANWGTSISLPEGTSLSGILMESIGAIPIRLSAQLDSTELSLLDMKSLEVGDVLVLSHKASDPVSLNHNALKKVASGRIGENDGFKSLKLIN